jgi:hypothetical protein
MRDMIDVGGWEVQLQRLSLSSDGDDAGQLRAAAAGCRRTVTAGPKY